MLDEMIAPSKPFLSSMALAEGARKPRHILAMRVNVTVQDVKSCKFGPAYALEGAMLHRVGMLSQLEPRSENLIALEAGEWIDPFDLIMIREVCMTFVAFEMSLSEESLMTALSNTSPAPVFVPSSMKVE